MKDRDSPEWPRLMPDLEPWLDRPFESLPEWLKVRLRDAGFSLTSDDATSRWWDESSSKQRRWRAESRDCENDPEMEASRQRVWQLVTDHGATRREIEEWEAVGVQTASDLHLKKTKLAELRPRLAELDLQLRACGSIDDPPPASDRRQPSNAVRDVILAVMKELGLSKPEPARIFARLLDGRPVYGIAISMTKDANGSPVPVIAGKKLTRDALRKRLLRMFPKAEN